MFNKSWVYLKFAFWFVPIVFYVLTIVEIIFYPIGITSL